MTLTVRAAGAGDLSDLLSLYAELHPDDPRLPADDAARVWADIAAQPGRSVLLARDAGAAVGTADCVVVPNLTRGGRPYLLVENVVVRARARRRGVGRHLFEAVFAVARAAGCYKVQLLSRADRTAAHAFYESCGLRASASGYRAYLD